MKKSIILTVLFTFVFLLSQAQDEDGIVDKKDYQPFEDASIEVGINLAAFNFSVPVTNYSGISSYIKASPTIGIKGMYQFEVEENNFINFGISGSTYKAYQFVAFPSNSNTKKYYNFGNKEIVEGRLWVQYSKTYQNFAFILSASPLCISNLEKSTEQLFSNAISNSVSQKIVNHTVGRFISSVGIKYAINPKCIATAEVQVSLYNKFQHILQLGINYSIKDIIE